MRSPLIAVRAAGVAVALTACSAVTAPAAVAAVANEWDRDRPGVTADPNPAEPGAQVKLRVHGCDGDRGVALSPVFVSEAHLFPGHDGRRTLRGDAVISSHARPGWHEIKVKCGGRDGSVRGSIEIRHREHHRPHPHHSPVWPVHAGGGGMAAELPGAGKPVAAEATAAKKTEGDDGPGMPHTVIGAVLAAAATLAAAGRALTLRRRRSGG